MRISASAEVSPNPQKIDVLRRANRLTEPRQEEGRPFEDEPIGELALRQPVQQALAAKAGECELMLDTEFAAPFDQACLHGCRDVLGTGALHRSLSPLLKSCR
jgi:hypothetical protein